MEVRSVAIVILKLFPLNICLRRAIPYPSLKSIRLFDRRSKVEPKKEKVVDDFFTHLPKNNEELKQKAYEILDYLACPYSMEDPDYDPIKAQRRDRIVSSLDYTELKFELLQRGLPKSGERVEMFTRLLLHIIDPTIDYRATMFTGEKLSYLTPKDIREKNITVRNEEERIKAQKLDLGPDSDDLKVFRRIPRKKPWVLLDGLDRRETKIPLTRVFRSPKLAHDQDRSSTSSSNTTSIRKINAYLVASNDIIKQSKNGGIKINIFLTNERGWKSKAMRIIADEIALKSDSLVIVPDLFRERHDTIINDDELKKSFSTAEKRRIFDDIIATFQFSVNELQPRAISLFGLGIGAGFALEYACDAHSISCEGMRQQIDQILSSSSSSLCSSESKEGWNIEEMIRNDLIATYLHEHMWLRKQLKERPPKIPQRKSKKQLEEEEDEDDDRDDDEKELSEIEDLEEDLGMIVANSNDDGEEDEETSDEELRKQIQDFANEYRNMNQSQVMTSSDLKPDTKTPTTNKRKSANKKQESKALPNKASTTSSSSSSITSVDLSTQQSKQISSLSEIFDDNNLNQNNYTEYYDQLRGELQHVLERSKYCEEKRLMQLNNSKISPVDIMKYVPNALIAWNAEGYDVEKVSKQLYTSLFFAEGLPTSSNNNEDDDYENDDDDEEEDEEDDMSAIISAERKKLCYELWKRRNDVLDFMFRLYEDTNTSFLHKPSNKHDLKCRQEALVIGSAFADMFNVKGPKEFIYNVGSNKYTLEVFSEVSKDQLLMSSVYSNSLNSQLHDKQCKLDYHVNEDLYDHAQLK